MSKKYNPETKPRIAYITPNRQSVIDFCNRNNGNISKAQTMNLLKDGNATPDLAYSVLKGMVDKDMLEKSGKGKFKLSAEYRKSVTIQVEARTQ